MNRRAALFSLVTLAAPAAAQELRFREYGPSDGLPAGHIFSITQDRTGHIWLAGARGVFQFDGHTFRHWTLGVPGGRAHALQETADGRIWVVASQGVAYLNPGEQAFRRVDIPVAHNAKLTRSIAAAPGGRLLLGEGNTLWSLGWKRDQLDIQSYSAPGASIIRAVAVDSAGRAWTVCGLRLCRLHRDALREETTGLPEHPWLALAAGPAGQLAVRGETTLWTRAALDQPFRPEPEPGAVAGFYVDATYSPEGDLLVNTTKGLAVRRQGRWRTIGIENGLATRTLTAIRLDREGNAWLGTASEPSILRWDRRAPWSTFTRSQGLAEETVWGVARDTAGSIWAAGSSGVFRLDANQRFQPMSSSEKEYARQLVATPDGAVWALLNRTKVRRFSAGATRDFDLPARALHYLLLDRQRRLWVIGDHVFRSTGDISGPHVRFEHLEPFATDQNEDFTQASLDPAGRVFLAGTNGLAIYNPARDTWERLGTKHGLQSLRLLAVLADSSGRVWVSYRQPLPPTRLVFDANGWQEDRAGSPPAFGRTLIVGFAEDRGKRIWVTTEAGVFVWNQKHWRHYRRDDGLRSEDSVAGSVLAADDGSVWVGTTRGLAWFDPHQPALPPVPPPVAALAGLSVENGSVSFGLRSLSYWREAEQLFLYRLHGRRFFGTVFDSGWQETPDPAVRYANLPGGDYRLEVKARNADQVWSLHPLHHAFAVPVPWYASGAFGFALFAGAPTLAYLALRERRRRRALAEDQSRRWLETELSQRTHELAEARRKAEASSRHKTELLAAMSEQVRTPIHAFMGLTQLALTARDESKRQDYLRDAHHSSELLLTTLADLLDYAESEAGRLVLHPAACDVAACVHALALQEGLSCHIGPGVPPLVRADRRRLRQVLQALVSSPPSSSAGPPQLTLTAELSRPLEVQLTFHAPAAQLPDSAGLLSSRAALRLAVVHRLIDLMGGRLAATPGRAGLTLTISCPIIPSDSPGPKRLLLADPDPVRRRALTEMLEQAGYAVTAATTAAAPDGFPVAVVAEPGLVPQLRDAELAAAGPARVRIVALVERGERVPAGADAVLQPPVDPDALLAAVSAATAAPR